MDSTRGLPVGFILCYLGLQMVLSVDANRKRILWELIIQLHEHLFHKRTISNLFV